MKYYLQNPDELYHFGIPGMKWGLRRYQNEDGTLTEAGRRRYTGSARKVQKHLNDLDYEKAKQTTALYFGNEKFNQYGRKWGRVKDRQDRATSKGKTKRAERLQKKSNALVKAGTEQLKTNVDTLDKINKTDKYVNHIISRYNETPVYTISSKPTTRWIYNYGGYDVAVPGTKYKVRDVPKQDLINLGDKINEKYNNFSGYHEDSFEDLNADEMKAVSASSHHWNEVSKKRAKAEKKRSR